ncbi:MAG TPA: hypothetical protein VK731_14180 [Candidatus Cybelea sp.]|jgi:hypothetical protein|nr:hypothetical protein [Candidatus Cybelea sp.]
MKTVYETNGPGIRTKGTNALARCTDACRAAARKLREFEQKLAATVAAEIQGSVPQKLIHQAMNEAEALAWSTHYPLLFLPDLAEEKIQGARQWARRQQQILER